MAKNKYITKQMQKRTLAMSLVGILSISSIHSGIAGEVITVDSDDYEKHLQQEATLEELLGDLVEQLTYDELAELSNELSESEIEELKELLDDERLEWLEEILANREVIVEVENESGETETEENVESEEVETETEENLESDEVVTETEENVESEEVETETEENLEYEEVETETDEETLVVLPEDKIGGGSNGKNHLKEVQEVMFMSEAGVMTIAEVAPIEAGGFAHLGEGQYKVPVSIKTVNDTSIKDASSGAIEMAVLTVDSSGNGTLSFSPTTYTRNGFGTALEQLTSTSAYLSDFAYYVSNGSDSYTAVEIENESGKTPKVEIADVDSGVSAMYISYTQNSTNGKTIDTLAYLEIDYAKAGDLVYQIGSGEFAPGEYDINAAIRSRSNSTFATANNYVKGGSVLKVEDDGTAYLTMNFASTSSWGTNYYMKTFSYFDDTIIPTSDSTTGYKDATINSTVTGNKGTYPTSVTFPISTPVTVTNEDYTSEGMYVRYTHGSDPKNLSASTSTATAFLEISYNEYQPEMDYDTPEEDRRFTFGTERRMFAPGEYNVKVQLDHASTADKESSYNPFILEDAILTVDADGNGTVTTDWQDATMVGYDGYVINISYYLGEIGSAQIDAEVLEWDGVKPRKTVFGYPRPNISHMYMEAQAQADWYQNYHDAKLVINFDGTGEPYDADNVTLRYGETIWDGDFQTPEIEIDGYTNNATVKLEIGDTIDEWTTPSATVTDNKTTGLTAEIFYASFNNDGEKIADLADEAAAKTYLSEEVGNIVRVYYTSQDESGNEAVVYLELISISVDNGIYADVTKNGVYSVPVKLLQENNDNTSMGDGAFDDFRHTKVTTKDGKYYVEVEIGTMTVGAEAGISNITSTDANVSNLKTVETSTTSGGLPYTSKFSFETDKLVDAYGISFEIDLGSGTPMPQSARLALDWNKAFNYGESAPVDIAEAGTFTVPVAMYQANKDDLSMGDGAFNGYRITNVYNMGDYYVFEGEMTYMTLGSNKYGVEAIFANDSDIHDITYTTANDNSLTSDNKFYVTDFVFTTSVIKDYYGIDMDLFGHDTTEARLGFDWSELAKTSEDTTNVPKHNVPAEKPNIEKAGTFTVPVAMHQAKKEDLSMGDGAFEGYRITNVYNMGNYYVFEGEMTYMTLGSNKFGVEGIFANDSDIYEMTYTKKADSNMTSDNKWYVTDFIFTTSVIKDYYGIDMDLYEHDTTEARLGFDWSELAKTSDNTANVPVHTVPDVVDVAPTITVQGYTNGDVVEVQMSNISTLFAPLAEVRDDKDTGLVATETITADGKTLQNFTAGKAYLSEKAGNEILVTFTATDSSGNVSKFNITFKSKLDSADANDGLLKNMTRYQVPVQLLNEYKDEPSMGDKAFDGFRDKTIVTNRDGIYDVSVEIGTVDFGSLTSGIANISSVDGKIYNLKEVYEDIVVDGKTVQRVTSFSFKTNSLEDDYMINFDVAGVEVSAGKVMNQTARLDLDWNNALELGEATDLYYTFGSDKTLFTEGYHIVDVDVKNPDDTQGSVLENSISLSNVMSVDSQGNGEIALTLSDIDFSGQSYEPTSIMYYTSADMTPSSLVVLDLNTSSKEVVIPIAEPEATEGVYISVGLGDTFMNVSAFVEIDYAGSASGEVYDPSKETDRVETPAPEVIPPVVVPPETTPETTTPESGNTSSSANIKDEGVFTTPVYLYHERNNQLSMGDSAISDRTTTVTNVGGEYTFDFDLGVVSYSGLVGGISKISSDDNIYDIQCQYSKDVNGESYVSKVMFTTKTIQDYYDVELYIPVMGNTVNARLYFDWSKLEKTSSDKIVYVYVETIVEVEVEAEATTATTTTEGSSSANSAEAGAGGSAYDDITVNGQYLVPITLMHEVNNTVSMGDPAFDANRYALVSTKDGVYTVTANPSTLTMSNLTSGLGSLTSTDGKMKNLNILEMSKLTTGEEYITSFQFTTNRLDNYYGISITVPNAPMGVTGARLNFDWSKAVSTNQAVLSGSAIQSDSIAQIVEDGGALTVKNEDMNVVIDSEALEFIMKQADGEEVSISIDTVEYEELTEEQQEVLLEDDTIFNLSVLIGDKVVKNVSSGKISVQLPYYLERSKAVEGLTVLHVEEDGEVAEYDCEYGDYSRVVEFDTNYFAIHAIRHDGSVATAVDYNGYDDEIELPFEDVSKDDWFYESAKFAYKNNLFSENEESGFAPEEEVTRSGLVTALYRLAGSPEVSTRNQFTDVLSDQEYTKAVLWAVENGISSGYGDGTFGVDDLVTREQMVTMVHRYGKLQGIGAEGTADLSVYNDKDSISEYALESFDWAVSNGIISGNGVSLTPKNHTKRSEIATIAMNLYK